MSYVCCDPSQLPPCHGEPCRVCDRCERHCGCRHTPPDDPRKLARVRASRPTSTGLPREDETTRGGYR